MDKEKIHIVNVLRKHLPEIIAIYSFGSWGTPFERPDSDIDLAVLLQSPGNSADMWKIAQKVANIIGKDVDLVDLLQASTVMRSQVITANARLYCSDRVVCECFEDYVYASYARLNEERRGILEDVGQRGSVYGR